VALKLPGVAKDRISQLNFEHLAKSVLTAIAPGSVGTAELADDAVTNAKLADNAVGAAEIIDGSVGAAEIGTGAVGTDELAANAVTTAKIADSQVTSAKIADSTIATADIGNSQVTKAKLATDALQAFLQLDANTTRNISFGSDTVTWGLGVESATSKTINHGLGTTPIWAYATAYNSNTIFYNAFFVGVDSWTSSEITFAWQTTNGINPGSGATDFYWAAIA
jgi:hypothetical protein